MTKQDIQEYVVHTPYNTNPAIIGSMIDELGGGGSSGPVIHLYLDDDGDVKSRENLTDYVELAETPGEWGKNARFKDPATRVFMEETNDYYSCIMFSYNDDIGIVDMGCANAIADDAYNIKLVGYNVSFIIDVGEIEGSYELSYDVEISS